ncbi:MAG: WG repeat-containing protein [Synergistaceae bacterium]|nr:WG repeat-containing protein [Synergistaceae bacterium]
MKKNPIFTGILSLIMAAAVFGAAKFAISSAKADSEDFELKWIIPPVNNFVNLFADERVWVRKEKGGTWTLYDINGNIIKDDFIAKIVNRYKNGYARFVVDEKREGFLNISGDEIIPPTLRDELIRERGKENRRLFGFVNMEGDWVIPAEYEQINNFSEELAAVKKGEKWGYIDKRGIVVVDFLFENATSFENGTAIVMYDSKIGMIDRNGNFIIEPIYDKYYNWGTERDQENPIGLTKGGKVGFVNAKGDIVIDFKFKTTEEVSYNVFRNGLAVVVLDEPGDEKAVIDEAGNVLFRIGKEIKIALPVFYDDFIVGQTGKQILVFDKDGHTYDIPSSEISPYFDETYVVLPSNNLFTAFPTGTKAHKLKINDRGYFKITRKEGN